MRWAFKKNKEDENFIEIGYSHGQNENCDGIIVFDKSTEKLTIKKFSKGCDQYDSKRAFQFIYGLLEDKQLSFKKYIVCTG